MCGTCGCGGEVTMTVPGGEAADAARTRDHGLAHHHHHDHHGHAHSHSHSHGHHAHDHGHDGHVHHDEHHHRDHYTDEHGHGRNDHRHPTDRGGTTGDGRTVVEVEARVLAKNDALAAKNRAWFAGREILAVNLVSGPGAGKTTLLERTIRDLRGELPLFVVEGDQATANDGARIRAAGAPVVQINTGTGCHLEADMVARGLMELKPRAGAVVLIENVGNLVCPAMFDLGERAKVALLSVTEGEDKPLKYPHMFRAAEVVILNKIDLLPYVDFDAERAVAYAREVNPDVTVLRVSAKSGEGLDAWYGWLRREHAAAREATWI